MSDDLVTWLRQQLDDEERVARAAWKGDGWRQGEYVSGEPAIAHEVWTGRAAPGHTPIPIASSWDVPTATHISRHDPARVLADVAAKRAILDAHDPDWPRLECPTCCGYDGNDNYGREIRPIEAYPCRAVRLLAQSYADRPGYRDEWRPA